MQEHYSTDEFDTVAVAQFTGECSVAELPLLFSASGSKDVFGDTDIDRSLQVQAFFHVNCSQIIRYLRPSLDRLSVPMRNMIFGRALGRVIAHEIYHIVARTTDHADSGVAKPSFSLNDLIGERFHFTPASLERLRLIPSFSPLGN